MAADEGLTAEEERKCRVAFSEVDLDGSGMLDMKELADVLENQTGVRPSATEMKVLQARLGLVSSGTEADASWCARCSCVHDRSRSGCWRSKALARAP